MQGDCELILMKGRHHSAGRGGMQQEHARANALDVLLQCSFRTHHRSKQATCAVFAPMLFPTTLCPLACVSRDRLNDSDPPGLNTSSHQHTHQRLQAKPRKGHTSTTADKAPHRRYQHSRHTTRIEEKSMVVHTTHEC